MVRIDMSEYGEKHSVARLVGAPPGYVGYEEGGQLTEAVRRRPYTVVLLDEVEKAHPEVFDVLLQVLDDGRLTDGQGRTVDFRNAILILTSNLGSAFLVDPTLAARRRKREAVMARRARRRSSRSSSTGSTTSCCSTRSRPRSSPASSTCRSSRLRGRLADRRIALDGDRRAREWLALAGYDPVYGARPLRRLVQTADRRPAGQGAARRRGPRRRHGHRRRRVGRLRANPRIGVICDGPDRHKLPQSGGLSGEGLAETVETLLDDVVLFAEGPAHQRFSQLGVVPERRMRNRDDSGALGQRSAEVASVAAEWAHIGGDEVRAARPVVVNPSCSSPVAEQVAARSHRRAQA